MRTGSGSVYILDLCLHFLCGFLSFFAYSYDIKYSYLI